MYTTVLKVNYCYDEYYKVYKGSVENSSLIVPRASELEFA